MFELPTEIVIKDKQFSIRDKGDFRMILDCFSCLQDIEIPTQQERVMTALIIFYEDINDYSELMNLGDLEIAVKEMYRFFNCGQVEVDNGIPKPKLIDWEKDQQMIASAINSVAQTEVRAIPYLHWWTFMGYYNAIGESTFSTVMSIRGKIKKGKKLEKWESEYRQNNPDLFIWNSKSVEAQEEDEFVKSLWNSIE